MLGKRLKQFIFLDAYNLIRTELIFAILFGEFFALLFKAVADVEVYYSTVHLFSLIVLALFLFSFFNDAIKNNLRAISNAVYVSGILYILYVAYVNQFNASSLFAVIIVYGFFSFMLSSVKVFWRLTFLVISALFIVLILLNFQTKTSLFILFTSIALLVIAGYSLTSARVYYQNRIKDREQLLKHIFNSSHMGFLLINAQTNRIDNINDFAINLLGIVSREEAKLKKTADLKLNNFPIIDEQINKSIELEDNRIVRVNTQKIEYKSKAYILVFLDVFQSIRDMEKSLDLKRLQEQFEQSYQYLFEESSSFMCIIDEDDVVLDINQSFSQFVGLSKETIIKEGFDIFTISEPENRKELNQKAREGKNVVFEKLIRDSNGEERRLEIVLRKGKYFGKNVLISNGRDITERARLQKQALLANERYKKIANDSAIGFAVTNMEGEIIECNSAFLKIIGYSKQEIIGNSFEKISHPGDLELNNKLREKLLTKEFKVGEIEKRYYHKNGSIVYALLKLFYEEDQNGGDSYFFAQIVDITQIRNAQKEVELSEKSYRELFDNSEDFIFIVDTNNSIVDINSSIIENLGYKKGELLSKPLNSLSAPGQNEQSDLIKDLNKVRTGEVLNRIWWVLKTTGEVIPLRVNIRNANYFQKKVLIINAKDISDSYYFERKLKEKEKRYRELFERNLAGVYRTSISGEILECNPAFLNILGYSEEEVKAKSFNAIDTYLSEKNRESLLTEVEEKNYIKGKKLQLKRKDGEAVTVLLNVSKITNENNQFLYYEGSIIDITELENIQNQLINSEKKI